MEHFKNHHILIVKAIPATNHKPVRIRIKSELFGKSKVISRGDARTVDIEACNYLASEGFDIVGTAEGSNNRTYVITNTFNFDI